MTHHKPSYKESQLNRSFFLTILAATATKRDAKAYIEKYQRPYNKAKSVVVKQSQTLQEFFEADEGTLIDVAPSPASTSPIRIALILVRDPAQISNYQLKRIAHTLGQLQRLGLQPVVIIDLQESPLNAGTQVLRFAQVLEDLGIESRPVQDGLFTIHNPVSMHAKRTVDIYDTRVLQAPLSRGAIPVIRTLGVDTSSRKRSITADSAMHAICKYFGSRDGLVVDKLIILDSVGGIHSPSRSGSHVYINLDQENLLLQRELALLDADTATKHLRNLDTCRNCLKLINSNASAVITTPEVAGSEAGTQHPLIHNLLTDKPLFSPSLPVHGSRTPSTSTTILRTGVPVTIHRHLKLPHPSINLEKLVSLINDSFGRELDVERYLERVGEINAIIIAGDYHGAAIVTTEQGIAYLDKFAVLRAKQGGGVADILFNSLKSLFPEELIWRSRERNPVNKWYFERARGTYLVNVDWRLFWTTEKIGSVERFNQYLDIASSIQPTWKT